MFADQEGTRMTDAPPEGPADVEPERGSRRSPRVGDSGSPVGSTLSIVLAVIAVIAGFLILRAVTNDDDGDDGLGTTNSTVPVGVVTTLPGESTAPIATPAPTAAPVAKNAATVSVANASGVAGSAAGMSTALQTGGYTMGTPGNSTGEKLTTSIVYFVNGDANAQGVAALVAADMGGLQTAAMPTPPPIDKGLGTSTVLVMVGSDTAGKTLADLAGAGAGTPTTAASGVAPPAPVGVTTTTLAG
jgi:hypothetical protein